MTLPSELSPALVLCEFLRDQELGVRPEDYTAGSSLWVLYAHKMPMSDHDPDKAICLYNTAAKLDGRIMRTGEVIKHPGIACKVGDLEAESAYAKAVDLIEKFSQVKRVTVFYQDHTFRIDNCSLQSGIVSLGESEVRGRMLFQFNMFVTMSLI